MKSRRPIVSCSPWLVASAEPRWLSRRRGERCELLSRRVLRLREMCRHQMQSPISWGFGLDGGCMCGGPYPCVVNYFNYRQDQRLLILPGDYVSSGDQELHNLCQEQGITHLIYTGGATNMCLCQKPEGMIGMTRLGYKSVWPRWMPTTAIGKISAPGPMQASQCAARRLPHPGRLPTRWYAMVAIIASINAADSPAGPLRSLERTQLRFAWLL